MLNKIRFHLTYTQILLLGFLVVILTGTLLLCLPISSRTGEWTPLLPSAFTATSAACVTGLITVDTYTHWSVFGQVVILLLIQTGGLGLMTILTMLSVVLKRKVSLHEQRLAMLSAGGTEHGTILLLIKHIFILTFGFEFLGAVVLATQFIPLFGIGRGGC